MHERWKYITSQLNVVPKPVYEGLLALLCIGAIVFLAVNRKKADRYIALPKRAGYSRSAVNRKKADRYIAWLLFLSSCSWYWA